MCFCTLAGIAVSEYLCLFGKWVLIVTPFKCLQKGINMWLDACTIINVKHLGAVYLVFL